jgi:putative transposase
VAADRLQAVLDLEEPPARARPPRHRPGRPRAHPHKWRAPTPLWGAPRIHGELQKLGIEISQATVSKYVVRHRKPPSQTWRTFLDNHIRSLVSVDFFTVPTVLFKVLFVFVVRAHDRRRVVHVNVTDTPTAEWSAQAQQLVEAFPWDTAPRDRLRDRDAVYGAVFSSRVQALGILEAKTTPRSPWQNPYVERLIGTLRRECLDQRDPPAPPAARLSHLLPQHPNTPLPGQGRPRAQRGGVPRSRQDRRDAPGRRPPSPVQPPGRIGPGRRVPPSTCHGRWGKKAA